MAAFKYDHMHLRSPDPEATAAYYERMFGAKILRSVQSDGQARIDIALDGTLVFLAPIAKDAAAPPANRPYSGLEHFGLAVDNMDEAVAELKSKGAEFTVEPHMIRPGVRIAFIRGPENVHIEILERAKGAA